MKPGVHPRVLLPRDLTTALEAVRSATAQSRLLAGGTDLMVELENGRTQPDIVVDVSSVGELRFANLEEGGLRIGALATCTDLLVEPLVAAHADLLVDACRDFGSVQIRNRATLGGNLGTASPAADLNPVLLALDADVRLVSAGGQRDVPSAEFLCGYRKTLARPDELIHSVRIPLRAEDERRAFRKVGTRAAQSISKVVVALAVRLDGDTVTDLRAAAGSVAARTVLLPALRAELAGRRLEPTRIRAAVRATLAADVHPIDDVRSTAGYRRAVLGRVLERMLGGLSAPGG